MKNDLLIEIKQLVDKFQLSMMENLPALENETNLLIQSNSRDTNTIERMLDTLLSLTSFGIGKDLFVKLLEYYKTIDPEGAAFYWNEFDDGE